MHHLDREIEIKFPCEYPIKIMGRNVDCFEKVVLSVVEKVSPDLCLDTVTRRLSNQGKFVSLTVVIIATGKSQLERLHSELKATGLVSLVL